MRQEKRLAKRISNRRLFGHFGEEAVVEFAGGIVASGFEFGLEGGDFDKAG